MQATTVALCSHGGGGGFGIGGGILGGHAAGRVKGVNCRGCQDFDSCCHCQHYLSVIGSTSKASGDSMSYRATGCKQGDRGGGGRGAEGGRSAGGGEVVRFATQRCQRPARAPIQNPEM
jgi:hypothetical protein